MTACSGWFTNGDSLRVSAHVVPTSGICESRTLWSAAPPAGIEPAAIEPAAVVPSPIEPAGIEPAAMEPAAIEPAAIEPAAIDPAGIEPAVSAPAHPNTEQPPPSFQQSVLAACLAAGDDTISRSQLLNGR